MATFAFLFALVESNPSSSSMKVRRDFEVVGKLRSETLKTGQVEVP
jgi:hypothetical protein